MSDFYLVNEVRPNSDPTTPGDVTVYASAKAAEEYFEPWFVDETYLLLQQNGKRLIFVATGGKLRVAESNDPSNYNDTLRRLLIYHLESVERAIFSRKKIERIGLINFDQFSTEVLFKLSILVT